MIFLTVITINYNNCLGLERTIQSVISQSAIDFEFIVIDGNSSDGSVDVIKKFDSAIQHWISEKDTGVYNAMNKGWRLANGEYCIFLNSGDVFANEHVVKNIFQLADTTSDIIYGCHIWKVTGERWNPKIDFKIREILEHTPISHQATCVKKSMLEKTGGFDEGFKIISDWGVLIDAMFLHAKLQKISIDICIAEEAGESNVDEYQIKSERNRFLWKKHPMYFFSYLIVVKWLVKIKNLIKFTLS